MTTVADPFLSRQPEIVSEVLEEYGAITRRAMQRYLPAKGARQYLDELVADYPSRGGKMLRSSLCIATARAFGADIDDAIPAAVAIELLHNALLIHDDIEDGSDERRGKPTLHRLHGVPLALNAGASLAQLAMAPMGEYARRLGFRLLYVLSQEANAMGHMSAEGQALELGWCRENKLDVGDADYLDMIYKKTSWFFSVFPCRAGALIGLRGDLDDAAFIGFGTLFGAAFQIQDDILNLVASDARYGKERDGDLWEGKRTLILGHAYRHSGSAEQAEFARILALPRARKTAEEVAWLRACIDRHGSIEFARLFASGLAGAAMREFEACYAEAPSSRDKAFIHGLVTWVVERSN
jgi:geranylgeranyl diphosphate synthase type II